MNDIAMLSNACIGVANTSNLAKFNLNAYEKYVCEQDFMFG